MSTTAHQPQPTPEADPAAARRDAVLSELTDLCMDAARLAVAQARVKLSEGVEFDAEALSRALAALSRAVRLTLALQERFSRPQPSHPQIPPTVRAAPPPRPLADAARDDDAAADDARPLDAEPREDLRPAREQLVEFEAGVIDRPPARSVVAPEPLAETDAAAEFAAAADHAIRSLRFRAPTVTSSPDFSASRARPMAAAAGTAALQPP